MTNKPESACDDRDCKHGYNLVIGCLECERHIDKIRQQQSSGGTAALKETRNGSRDVSREASNGDYGPSPSPTPASTAMPLSEDPRRKFYVDSQMLQSLKAGDANCEQCSDLRTQLEAAKGQLKVYAIVLHNIEDVCIRAGADSPQNPETIGYVMELNRQLAAEKRRADELQAWKDYFRLASTPIKLMNAATAERDELKAEVKRLRKALEDIRDNRHMEKSRRIAKTALDGGKE